MVPTIIQKKPTKFQNTSSSKEGYEKKIVPFDLSQVIPQPSKIK
jgi:hypothetical protein